MLGKPEKRALETTVAVLKDAEKQSPIPVAWRPIICALVSALAKGDYALESGAPGIEAVSRETATQVASYIADYGEVLTDLSEEAWQSSVCIWMGDWWDVLVDLWTESEGRSDLVLSARVFESGQGYSVEMRGVYVP